MDLEGLSLVCNGLGFQFCLENMKDLQRFLRRDNPQTRDVFKQVCRFNTVAVDLVPIIEQHNDDRDLISRNAFVQGDQEGISPNPSVPNINSDDSSYENKNMDSYIGHGDYLVLKENESGADSQANRKKVRRGLHKSVDGTHQEMDFTQTHDMANLEDDVEDTPRNVFRKRQEVVFDLDDE